MARPRKTVIDTPSKRTGVIYARVSTREQAEGYSLDAQLALIRGYALKQGIDVVGEYVETESAKTKGRPNFSDMLVRVKRERIGAVLVEKTDRLYRNLHDYVKFDDIPWVEVHLVKESEVLSSDSNSDKHFMHGIRVLMARKYSMNLREETMKGMLQKARDGVWPTKAPLGYLNVSEGSKRIIKPDPERAPLVRAMIELYAGGDASIAQARDFATDLGLTTRKGKRLARCEVHAILRSPAYYGVVKWAGEEHPGIHEPIIDRATWVRCQGVMEGRNVGRDQPATAREHVYKGMFRCGRCGCLISAQTTKGHSYYACTGAKGCKRVGVREEAITAAIVERLRGVTIRPEVLDLLRETLRSSLAEERSLRDERVDDLERQRAKLKGDLETLYADRLTETVPLSIYGDVKNRLEAELASVEGTLAGFDGARRRFFDEGVALLEFAANAFQTFESASPASKREMARHLLSNPTITDGEVQVCLHETFEMILKANDSAAKTEVGDDPLLVWLPD